MTVKAQKAPGKASARPLHTCTHLAWNGAASVLHQVLSPALEAPWICASSRVAVRLIREGFATNVGCYLHIDIVDFFLQGTKTLLINAAAFYAPAEHQELVTRIATWLLDRQYVEFGALADGASAEVYKVRTGTGMGTRSSGCLANAGF